MVGLSSLYPVIPTLGRLQGVRAAEVGVDAHAAIGCSECRCVLDV